MKLNPFKSLLVTLVTTSVTASAASFITTPSGAWGTGANWSDGSVPAIGSGGLAVIDNGAAVSYNADVNGDFTINGGGSVSISNGSSWNQATTHWSAINTGTLALDNGKFLRSTADGVLQVGTA